ncbi:MAG: hypothetical protein ABR587_02955 [Candidatus Binatia bacterium]
MKSTPPSTTAATTCRSANPSRRKRQQKAPPAAADAEPPPHGEAPAQSPPRSGPRLHALAASALLLVYLAVMSGHIASMDGLLIYRQAHALVVDHSIRFQSPARFWTGEAIWNSKYGVGLSLFYVPGLLLTSPLASLVPISAEVPAKKGIFYYQQLYADPLYTAGASWVHAVIAAWTAYLVARLASALGCSRRASLWAMAFYGIGSSALVYSRGDFAQPLTGLCWTAALLAAVRVRSGGETAAIWACAAAAGYAIVTRPFEGMMLLPVVLVLVVPERFVHWNLRTLRPAFTVAAGALVAVGITLLINWARSGDAFVSGYKLDNAWRLPEPAQIAALLFGPARGILWEFPALVLVPIGAVALTRRGNSREARMLLLLCGALMLNTALWKTWWGGWCWGLRLFLPAVPLLAVVAGAGTDRLRSSTRRWLPGVLLAAGFVWSLPGVTTDLLGGFAKLTDASPMSWSLASFPPYGAWRFLKQAFPDDPFDTDVVDILWFRLAPATGYWSLLVPIVLLAAAAFLAVRCARELRDEERTARH